jgi:CheY-like chemotaxis protein
MICNSILVVDDEEDIRDSMRQILEYEGFQVRTASNGREGLDLLEAVTEPCLILLDLMMPVMDGWEFAKVLRSDPARSDSALVVVTAFVEKAHSIPSQGALRKPVELDALVAVAESHCRRAVPAK